jgi:hypothetical protein
MILSLGDLMTDDPTANARYLRMIERAHRKLDVWKASIDLVEAFYVATSAFPKDEMLGLRAQIRRAVDSVAANIAEGSARKSTPEPIQSSKRRNR